MAKADVQLWTSSDLKAQGSLWQQFGESQGLPAIHSGPRWLVALAEGLDHEAYVIDARLDGNVVGVLPLVFMKSLLFGRFLVSLPYLNWSGAIAEDEAVARALIDRAVELADELDVRYLELRHLSERSHPALTQKLTSKVQMHLPLSSSAETVWKQLKSVVRTQIRKGQKQGFSVVWGGKELLDGFYHVFAHNMRDLGTPVFGRRLFERILTQFPEQAELCVVEFEAAPVAGALAVHGQGITEVPSAAVLREFRPTAANSWMYWQLVERAVEREQALFDFGRSTIDSGTYVFKKKWGAVPEPTAWQYYVRKGNAVDMRPDGGKYDRAIKIWQRLPVGVTRLIGPTIVRGIP